MQTGRSFANQNWVTVYPGQKLNKYRHNAGKSEAIRRKPLIPNSHAEDPFSEDPVSVATRMIAEGEWKISMQQNNAED